MIGLRTPEPEMPSEEFQIKIPEGIPEGPNTGFYNFLKMSHQERINTLESTFQGPPQLVYMYITNFASQLATRLHDGREEEYGKSRLVGRILEWYRANKDCTQVMRPNSQALLKAMFVLVRNKSNAKKLVEMGAGKDVAEILEHSQSRNYQSLVAEAVDVLMLLSAESNTLRAVLPFRPLLVRTMETFPEDVEILTKIGYAFSGLTFDRGTFHKAVPGQMEAVLGTIRRAVVGASAEKSKAGGEARRSSSSGDGEDGEGGGKRTWRNLLIVLLKHLGNTVPEPSNGLQAAKLRATELLLNCLKIHSTDPEVAELVLLTLNNLCREAAIDRVAASFERSNGTRTVIQTLRENPNHPMINASAMGILYNARRDNSTQLIDEPGGIRTVLDAIVRHFDSVEAIEQNSCEFINTMTWIGDADRLGYREGKRATKDAVETFIDVAYQLIIVSPGSSGSSGSSSKSKSGKGKGKSRSSPGVPSENQRLIARACLYALTGFTKNQNNHALMVKQVPQFVPHLLAVVRKGLELRDVNLTRESVYPTIQLLPTQGRELADAGYIPLLPQVIEAFLPMGSKDRAFGTVGAATDALLTLVAKSWRLVPIAEWATDPELPVLLLRVARDMRNLDMVVTANALTVYHFLVRGMEPPFPLLEVAVTRGLKILGDLANRASRMPPGGVRVNVEEAIILILGMAKITVNIPPDGLQQIVAILKKFPHSEKAQIFIKETRKVKEGAPEMPELDWHSNQLEL